MFCSKADMQIVEKVQYKTLQVVYNIYMAIYDELLALNNNLALEIYSSENMPNLSFIEKHIRRIFTEKDISLLIPHENTQKYGIHSFNFRGNVLWDNLPVKLKQSKSLQDFKLLLKQTGNLLRTC